MQWQGKGRVPVAGPSGQLGQLAWQAEAMAAMPAGVVAVAMTATVEATGLRPPTALLAPMVDVGAGHGASDTRETRMMDWEAQAGDL